MSHDSDISWVSLVDCKWIILRFDTGGEVEQERLDLIQ
jgi:hypothetical protein